MMKLVSANEKNIKSKPFWLVSMFYEDEPDDTKFWLCASEEEAREVFNNILPGDIALEIVQDRARRLFNTKVRTRQEIVDSGEFVNPFGSHYNLQDYNGFASIYRVRRICDGEEVSIGYGNV